MLSSNALRGACHLITVSLMRHQDEVIDYICETFSPEDALLADIRLRLAAHNAGLVGIQVSPVEGKLLQMLVKMNGIRSIVEIGSLAGYSATWMARGLPEGGVLHAIEKDAGHFALLQQTVTAAGLPIKAHHGDALEVLKSLEAQAPFDMVFIDADKGGYVDYLNWAEKHMRKGGLIVGDNTLLFGHVHHAQKPEAASRKAWEAMREFNARLGDANRYDSILIPTAEGLTVAVKRF